MLRQLINVIIEEHAEVSKEWEKLCNNRNIKFSKKCISDIYNDITFLNMSFTYRVYLIKNQDRIKEKISSFEKSKHYILSNRIKLENSIQYKIYNYMISEKHEKGEVPINKCLNDLFGLRVILPKEINFEFLENYISKNYKDKLRCVKSIRGDYVATHIYFKYNNYTFPWELQIWDKVHEKTNLKSHADYKQNYAKWEKKMKGDDENW